MSEILLKAEEARGAANEMRNRATTADEQFTATRSRLTELAGSFKGKTATAFDETFNDWRESATKLLDALNNLAQFLDSAADKIVEVDEAIAGQLKG